MRKISAIIILIIFLVPVTMAISDSPEITGAPGQVNPYNTRSELLMEATAHTGVFTPEQAAEVWAKGLMMRSAAMQYTVMTDALKGEYAGQLDALRSNWVTGVSSPWVEGFELTETKKPDEEHRELSLRFETVASAMPSRFYGAKLWLVREGEFWRIERIWADEELYWYTLYRTQTL